MLNKLEKEKLANIERAYWKNESMVKHCVGEAAFLYDFRGKTVVIEKRGIKKHFCFGYSDYPYTDYDRANNMAAYARKNQHYFITENHNNAGYAERINCLNSSRFITYARPHYCGNCPDLYSIEFCWDYEKVPDDAILLTDSEKQEYKRILVKAIQEHHKKIMTYLKKYGLSKVESWSYWQDE